MNALLDKTANEVISEEKTLLIEEIKEAIDELNLIKEGKMEARNAEEFLKELSAKPMEFL